MDLLIILRDALASSVIGGLVVAVNAKRAGGEVAALFTQEALAALAFGAFEWPRELSGQDMRLLLADRGAEMGLPLMARGEARQLDAKGMLDAAREAGVLLYACPTWSSLLGLNSEPPRGLQGLKEEEVVDLIQRAKKVVGSL